MRIRGLGKLRWPWKATTVTPADLPPRVMLNRYPGQIIGIAFRLPDEPYFNRVKHKQLSITWARPDVTQYPKGWRERRRRDVGALGLAVDKVEREERLIARINEITERNARLGYVTPRRDSHEL